MLTPSGIGWITFQLLEFVKRSRYSNRAVIVIYSNRTFSTDYSHCSHYTAWSKSFKSIDHAYHVLAVTIKK